MSMDIRESYGVFMYKRWVISSVYVLEIRGVHLVFTWTYRGSFGTTMDLRGEPQMTMDIQGCHLRCS
jgi:hypothetical protein